MKINLFSNPGFKATQVRVGAVCALVILHLLMMSQLSFAKVLNPFQKKSTFICYNKSNVVSRENFIKIFKDTNFYINDIRYNGLYRTSSEKIKSADVLQKNFIFNVRDLDSTLEKYEELGIFEDITPCFNLNFEFKKMDVYYTFNEAWTIIPYMGLSFGGGSQIFTIGLIDTNFLKTARYFNYNFICKNSLCSSNVLFENKHFLEEKSTIGFAVKKITKYNVFYDEDKNIVGNFISSIDFLQLKFLWKFTSFIYSGLGLEYKNTQTFLNALSQDQIDFNSKNNYKVPSNSKDSGTQIYLTLGKIKTTKWVSNGARLEMNTTLHPSFLNTEKKNYSDFYLTGLYYLDRVPWLPIRLVNESNLAFRLVLNSTGSSLDSNNFYIGGLDKVRGFVDNAFSGKTILYGNAEVRINSIVTSRGFLQNVFFYDQGFVSNKISDIFSTKTKPTSLGLGIRLIPQFLSQIAIRMDYGFGIYPYSNSGLSFGFTQFF